MSKQLVVDVPEGCEGEVPVVTWVSQRELEEAEDGDCATSLMQNEFGDAWKVSLAVLRSESGLQSPVPVFLDVVFDGPPSHLSGRFVEVETPEGNSISPSEAARVEWIEPVSGEFWRLRFRVSS